MSTTQSYPDGTGLTFEKVWAMFQATDKQFKESRERADRERQELDEKIEASQLRIEQSLAKLDARIAKTHKEIGNLGNRMGDVIEQMIATGVKRHFNALGFNFTDVMLHREIVDPDTRRTLTELDIVLENGEYVIAVEVKTKPSTADINRHIQRLHIFRESRNRSHPGDTKKIYGAMASPVFPPEQYGAAIAAGFYTVTQSGKSIVVNVPEAPLTGILSNFPVPLCTLLGLSNSYEAFSSIVEA